MYEKERERLTEFIGGFPCEAESDQSNLNVYKQYKDNTVLTGIVIPLLDIISDASVYLLDKLRNDPETLRLDRDQLKALLCADAVEQINQAFPHDLGGGHEFISINPDPIIMMLLRSIESFVLCGK